MVRAERNVLETLCFFDGAKHTRRPTQTGRSVALKVQLHDRA
jgi:hypothetical protein